MTMTDPHTQDESPYTPFRLSEKHYKARSGPTFPNLHGRGILDLSRPEKEEDDLVYQAGWWADSSSSFASTSSSSAENLGNGLLGNEKGSINGRGTNGRGGQRKKQSKKGKEIDRGFREESNTEGLRRIVLDDGNVGWVVSEGCILLPQYLPCSTQLTLLTSSLSQYTKPPNPLSLDTHYLLPPNLFELYSQNSQELIFPKYKTLPLDIQEKIASLPPSRRDVIDTPAGAVLDYQEILDKTKSQVEGAGGIGGSVGGGGVGGVPSHKAEERTAGELMKEIRWANLGWVYQWASKAYDFTPETPIPFPPELAKLCSGIVQKIPWNEVFTSTGLPNGDQVDSQGGKAKDSSGNTPPGWSTWKDDYVPDTGIVNFYQIKDTLMGHVDRAELDPSRPLVSISLGHSCIFLLGGSSRQTPPTPIILRSGDVLIMSGKGRQSYHGVPRIMEGTLPSYFSLSGKDGSEDEEEDEMIKAAKRWIRSGRININVRQVFPPGFERPPKGS